MNNTSCVNMTEGSPQSHIVKFAMPLLLGLLFQQFYNMVDAVIVGKILGVDALAGVGSTGAVNFLVLGFCSGICYGFSLPIAQRFGAKDINGLKKYVGNIIWLSITFAVVITVVSCLFCKDILTVMSTPSDVYKYAYDYIIIIFAGIPAIFIYNTLANIMRALGDSKRPLIYVTISSVTNIVLDILFIRFLGIGVGGAAIATVASQLFSGLLCLRYIIKKVDILHISKEDIRPKLFYIKSLCLNGIPMGLQYSITAIGSVLLQSSVNILGSQYVAAVTAGSKLGFFFVCPFDALGSTMATYTGQNVGAEKYERVKKGMICCFLMGIVYSALAFVVLFFAGDKLSLLFLDSDKTEIIGMVHTYLKFYSVSYVFLLLVNTFRFSIQGMGFAELAMVAGVFELIARGVMALWIIPRFGFTAVCLTNPLAWAAADLFLVPAFFMCLNHLKNKRKRVDKHS